MSKYANMSLAKGITTTGNTETSPAAAGGGQEQERAGAGAGAGAGEKKETKTVQTVDYRESAGGQQHDTRPVEVVHEIPSKENDPVAAAKQD